MHLLIAALIGFVVGFLVGCVASITWKERRDAGVTAKPR